MHSLLAFNRPFLFSMLMNSLSDMYQQMILDHKRSPRNHGELTAATAHAEGFNRVCGDHIFVHLEVIDDRVADISFTGDGCAISTAAASLMTEAVKGKTIKEVEKITADFQQLLTTEDEPAELGKLAVFAGVRQYPMRVKCATLAWHTLQSALKDSSQPVSTEDDA